MTIPIRNPRIDVYRGHDATPNSNDDPDLTIPGSDILEVAISARTDEVMDDASITLHNRDDRYTEEYPLQQADRITFAVPMESPERYGNGDYGYGMWGGTHYHLWTGRITDISGSRDSPVTSHLELEARDYPADILSNRKITNAYVDDDVGAIIRDICRRKAPEIDRRSIPDFGVTTDVKYSSADCWDAVMKLAARVDALAIPTGQRLRIEEIDGLPYAFEIDENDLYLPISTETDDQLKNVVRIDSGENRKVEESQESVDSASFVTVDDTNRITHRLRARKAQVHSVDLYVQRNSEDEDLELRIQSDEGGAPVAIDDTDSDIASASWEYDNLPDDDWKAFFFDEHTLADRDPWLIIESAGVGHDIGHNSTGTPAYRSYYPHPLNFEVVSNQSVREYGAREIRIERSNLKTLTATRDAAEAELARRAWPSKTVECEVASRRAHLMEPGYRIDINRPQDGVSGEHIVTEVDRTWSSESTILHTAITAEWRKGVLAPL